jgi:hypothetical protein
MRRFLQLLSWTSLIAVILPAFLFLAGTMELPTMKTVMWIASASWFTVTPLWMGRKSKLKGTES